MTDTSESYSPGLEGVVAGETAISTIEGGLQYRGYSIQDLAENAAFEEVAYLLIHGELPNPVELTAFTRRVAAARPIPGNIIDLFRTLPTDSNAMDVLRTGVSIFAHSDPDTGAIDAEANKRKAERLLGAIPTLVTAWSRIKAGKEPI